MKKIIGENKLTFILFFTAHLLALFFTTGHLNADEHFQILEFLNFKLNHSQVSDLPWEYQAHMRAWFLPFIYFGLSKLFIFCKIISPFIHVVLFKLLSILLGTWSTLACIDHFLKKVPEKLHKTFINITALIWFLPFIHSRLSSEAIASSLLLLGVIFSLKEENKKQYFGGLLLGLSFVIRFHTIFTIFPLLCYFLIISKKNQTVFRVLLGILATSLVGFFIDWWGYGTQAFVQWNYVYQNVFLNKSQNYGTSPWWSYFYDINKKLIPPLGIIVIISTITYWIKFKKDLITWLTLPFFLIHCLVGHKEWRFLLPIAPFAPLILIKIIETMPEKFLRKAFIFPISLLNLFLLFTSSIRSVHPSFEFYQYMSKQKFKKIAYLGEENPFFIHQLKVNYYGINQYSASLISKESIPNETPVFVSQYKFYQYLSEEKKCQLLYSENAPNIVLILNSIPFAFVKNQLERSKQWALFSCPEKK